jgi:hypothetical protein
MIRPTLHDYLSWVAICAAKRGARRFAEGEAGDFYDHHFQARHSEQFRRDVRMVSHRHEVLAALQDLPGDATVVDVGGGVGDILREFPHSMERIGVDISDTTATTIPINCRSSASPPG